MVQVHRHLISTLAYILFMSTNTNLSSNSQYVSSNLFKTALVGLNNVKGVFPLNLPRANTNYLIAFLDSHVIHYPTPITLTYAWSSYTMETNSGGL